MTPPHSTLRISALYHARGMISESEYREFRRMYLCAMLEGEELPELPDAWHHVPPGTHTLGEEEESTVPNNARALTPRLIALVLAIAVVAIGGLIALIDLG